MHLTLDLLKIVFSKISACHKVPSSGHFESPSKKTDILSFCDNKRLLLENSLHQINHLPKSFLWRKKIKEIECLTLATKLILKLCWHLTVQDINPNLAAWREWHFLRHVLWTLIPSYLHHFLWNRLLERRTHCNMQLIVQVSVINCNSGYLEYLEYSFPSVLSSRFQAIIMKYVKCAK